MTDASPRDNAAFRQRDYVAGEFLDPEGDLGVWLCDPSTGERIALQAATAPEVVERALAEAEAAHARGTWSDMPVEERAALLERIADALDARVADIAVVEGASSGLPAPIASAFAGSMSGNFRDVAAMIREQVNPEILGEPDRPVELWRLPWGPTAILVPWNAAGAMAAKKTAYALGAGNTVILKPPEWAPFACTHLAEAIDEVGLPRGVFGMVHGGGDVGQALTGDPRVRAISFTGSVPTGREVARAGAGNFTALQLELGGNNPVIVRADADVAASAASLAAGMVKLNGQWCEGPGKVWVAASLHDEFVAALLDALSTYTLGAHTEAVDIGPLAHESRRIDLQAQVDRLVSLGGKELVAAQPVPAGGWFWAPRVVVGAPEGECVEEMFGPVVTVHSMDDEAAAIAAANASPYGLAAYVFGTDIEGAMAVGRALRFGEVKVNGTSLLDMSEHSAQSFWRCSGLGGHGNRDLLAFFQGVQIVGMDRPGVPI